MARLKPRVLVVDDDPDLQRLVQTLLGRIGVETIVAYSAADAAQILLDPPLPDLVILDLMLPEVSGLDFLREIRTRAMYNDLPVLVLSAVVEPQAIREALDAGADRYLTKPYLAKNLTTTVQEVMATGRRART